MTRTDRARALFHAIALIALVAAYLQTALSHAVYNWKVYNGDQNSYLRLALRIREGEGFANGNFHPLVAALFSPWASRDWAFFSQAKLLNIALGALLLVLVFVLGRRIVGSAAALLATAALALGPGFALRAARSEPEILLTGLFFAAWAAWVLGQDRMRWALAAGFLGGLAYLAKGTGQFLLLGFVALPLLRHGPAGWWARRRLIGAMVAAYLLAAAPLLITNWRHFGSPFYAFPSAHAMWYDDWDERLASPDGRHATARTYLASHAPHEIAARLAEGLREVPPEWASAFRIAWPTSAPRILGAVLLLALALLGLEGALRRREGAGSVRPSSEGEGTDRESALASRAGLLRDAAWTLSVLLLPLYLFFAWYAPIANSERFVLPLVPIAYTVLAGALAQALRRGLPQLATAARRWAIAPLAVTLLAFGSLREGEWRRPADVAASDRENNADAIAVLGYLAAGAGPGEETLLWGPGDLATWTLHGRASFKPVLESTTDFRSLEAYRAELGARRILLAPKMVERREEALGAYFRVQDEQVVWDQLPPGWRVAFRVPEDGCRFCVFEAPP